MSLNDNERKAVEVALRMLGNKGSSTKLQGNFCWGTVASHIHGVTMLAIATGTSSMDLTSIQFTAIHLMIREQFDAS